MKLMITLWLIGIGFLVNPSFSQNAMEYAAYEESPDYPWGRLNPEAPTPVGDYQQLIGTSTCQSSRRNQDQSWSEPIDMIWTFRYIMNGMAVQDETIKSDGLHSGSIRQFSPQDSQWYVHYYASASPIDRLPSWEGAEKKEDVITLHRPQKAPNGIEGFYRTKFYNISDKGFNWVGAWVSHRENEQFNFETWKISCTKLE